MPADDEAARAYRERVRRLLETPAVGRARATLAAANRAFAAAYIAADVTAPAGEGDAAVRAAASGLGDAVVGLLRAHEAAGHPGRGLWVLLVGAAVGPQPGEPPADVALRERAANAATAAAWAGIEAAGGVGPASVD